MGDGIPSALTAGHEAMAFYHGDGRGPAGSRGGSARLVARSHIRMGSAVGQTFSQMDRAHTLGICVGLGRWDLPIKDIWFVTGTPTPGLFQGRRPGADGASFFWRNGPGLTDKGTGISIGVWIREERTGRVADVRRLGEWEVIVVSGGGPAAWCRYPRVEGKRGENRPDRRTLEVIRKCA